LRRKGIRVTAGVCGGEREMGNEEGERLEEWKLEWKWKRGREYCGRAKRAFSYIYSHHFFLHICPWVWSI
jgi:hypothetical protein